MGEMPAADVIYQETEDERIDRWRCEVLERAGYDGASAEQLARRHDVDLHRAVDLVKSGCPPQLAAQILL